MVEEAVRSVTVPPIQNVGPTDSTLAAPFVGRTIVQVRSCADPGLFESGSISGSSWPVQLDVYHTNSCEWCAIQADCDIVLEAAAGPVSPKAAKAAAASAERSATRLCMWFSSPSGILGGAENTSHMSRAQNVALALLLVCVAGGAGTWAALHNTRGYTSTHGARILEVTVHSRLLRRSLTQLVVLPRGGGKGRPLLVLLHGRSSSPSAFLSDPFFEELHALGGRAPDVLLANGGDHSYYHNRRDGPWGSYILREAIPAGLAASHADRHRVAIGGVSMGGFGALDLARLRPKRFCAVGGHSAALWFSGGDTPAGAFDDAADFARHDVIRFARHRLLYHAARRERALPRVARRPRLRLLERAHSRVPALLRARVSGLLN